MADSEEEYSKDRKGCLHWQNIGHMACTVYTRVDTKMKKHEIHPVDKNEEHAT
jgi:hypothetical protein